MPLSHSPRQMFCCPSVSDRVKHGAPALDGLDGSAVGHKGGAMFRSGYIRGSFAFDTPQPLAQNGHHSLAHKGSTISSIQMSCLALIIEHLTSIAHRLTLQSCGRRFAFAVSHLHHSCLHHVSLCSATRHFLCWFVLLANRRAPLVFWASESQR